ncbi:MAG: helix-turn-helix transcriptional regulator [Anaerolineales bacterium]|jgi:predicted ArsR family transcriptional regulator
MPTTTRQKILDYLKRNRTVSSHDLARALQMTPANARYHLGILAADGRVEVISQRQEGRGRPEKVYRLAGTLAGDNLSVLTDALLTEAGGKVEMEALGKQVAGESNNVSDQPLMRKLASLVERLDAMHYQARWEAGAKGPRIILGHCPYSTIIEKHPELCRMDLALLSELLKGNLRQTAKLESGAGGLPFCAFEL